MKKLLLFLFFIFISEVSNAMTDCGQGGFWGWSMEQQDCNRCKFNGGELYKDCMTQNKNLLWRETFVMRLDNVPNDDSQNYNYSIKYSYCFINLLGNYSNDGCGDGSNSGFVPLDFSKMVNSPSECENNWQGFPGIDSNNPIKKYYDNKICLVKISRDQTPPGMGDFRLADEDNYAVCAGYKYSHPITGSKEFILIGCAPHPMPIGPAPFSKGIVPITTFVVSQGAYNDKSTFQNPSAYLDVREGGATLESIQFDITLKNNEAEKTEQYNDLNFIAKITNAAPDEIAIYKGNSRLGKYPRKSLASSALLEDDSKKLSFFPCYHTYTDAKGNKYQAIYPFSINASVGDGIGKTQDGQTPLYLGPNYLPSTSPDKVGNITETKCDLCINAADNPQWKDNLYKAGYSLSDRSEIKGCILDDKIKIEKIGLVDQTGELIAYQNLKQEPAPLRVDMFDIDEQKDVFDEIEKRQEQTPVKRTYSYEYKSETAFLDQYLVRIKPIIPEFKTNPRNEVEWLRATQNTMDSKGCSSYQGNSGSIFIKPAGKRNRDCCVIGGNSKCAIESDVEARSTICSGESPNERDSLFEYVCPGLYQGPKVMGQIDQICLMSADTWDFISGRYSSEDAPGMACTYLPGCPSLGTETVPNIGKAIWDVTASFNETKEGKCDFNDETWNGNHSYRYEINEYKISDDLKSDNLTIALEELIKQKKDKFYISEEDLGVSTVLLEAYKKYPEKLFICKRILPEAKCIGGIYGDVNQGTSCVEIAKDEKPIRCTIKNE